MICIDPLIRSLARCLKALFKTVSPFLNTKIFFGRSIQSLPDRSIVFFPCHYSLFFCGLAGIVTFVNKRPSSISIDIERLEKTAERIFSTPFSSAPKNGKADWKDTETLLQELLHSVHELKQDDTFFKIITEADLRLRLFKLASECLEFCTSEEKWLIQNMGTIPSDTVETASRCFEALKDIAWSIKFEILENIRKIEELIPEKRKRYPRLSVVTLKKINTVLNSIDRLEVRGRDSAGLSILIRLDKTEYERFQGDLELNNLKKEFMARADQEVLSNRSINVSGSEKRNGDPSVTLALTYKVAAEIGNLGDNIRFLRDQIRTDTVFWALMEISPFHVTLLCHTRWASVGAITLANCHPVDNRTLEPHQNRPAIIHVCLNGDIDNYLELKRNLETDNIHIHPDITSDTKIIPLQIETYLRKGFDLEEAFRLAVCDFDGSHAIAMHSNLAPGKMFLAQQGSGQAIFIGMAKDHYMATSEVYGFVEETSMFLKLNEIKPAASSGEKPRGQIFILDAEAGGGIQGISAMTYEGSRIRITENDLKTTQITSRDIDRQGYP
ncbi:MAG: glutamine--fructose-6-phosphate aminotransferase, partial [Thermodesulfobacteriota bacterium]